MTYTPRISSALDSASKGGLSKYELQVLAENFPDLFHVFGLIDDLQDREETAEEMASRAADDTSKERAKVIERIEGHRTDLAGHLDNIDHEADALAEALNIDHDDGRDALGDEADSVISALGALREALAEARNSMSHIETECDEAPE